MTIPRNQLLGAFEHRFDYQSARTVLGLALAQAQLSEQDTYAPAAIEAICAAIEARGERGRGVAEHLRQLAGLSAAPPPAPKPEPDKKAALKPKPEPKPTPDKKARAEPAKAPEAAVAPAAPEAPAPVKADPVKAPAEPAPAKAPIVTFLIHGVDAGDGKVYVCGNDEGLGAWDVAKAPECARASDTTWTAQLSFPVGASLEFKFVKVDASGEATWQVVENLHLEVVADATIESTW